MPTTTDGLIFYGWIFPEDHTFPWCDPETEEEEDVEDWWRGVNGYESPFELFDENGFYIGDVEPPRSRIDAYFQRRREWDEAHPLPFKLVNYCSGDFPMWAIAVPDSVLVANRGSPLALDPGCWPDYDRCCNEEHEDVMAVRRACKQHGIRLPGAPKWYLASYWG